LTTGRTDAEDVEGCTELDEMMAFIIQWNVPGSRSRLCGIRNAIAGCGMRRLMGVQCSGELSKRAFKLVLTV